MYVITQMCTRAGDCVDVCPIDCIVPGPRVRVIGPIFILTLKRVLTVLHAFRSVLRRPYFVRTMCQLNILVISRRTGSISRTVPVIGSLTWQKSGFELTRINRIDSNCG
jgi:hypothetical protein